MTGEAKFYKFGFWGLQALLASLASTLELDFEFSFKLI